MAGESQTATLEFESEEARQTAMDGLDEHNPDSEAKLDEIMKAPIKAKVEADHNKPAEQKPVAEPEKKIAPDNPSPKPATPDDEIRIKKSDLPEGFDTIGKVFKSYGEAQALIERQTKFIKEKLGGGDQNLQAILKRAETAETELANLKKQVERPAQRETERKDLPAIPQSVAPKIKEIRQELQRLAADPITNEEKIHELRLNLDDLWLQENERLSLMVERVNQTASDADRRSQEASDRASQVVELGKKSEAEVAAEQALKNEFKQMDSFAAKYPEFKMSKSSPEVERDYAQWASDVTALFYGTQINIETKEGRSAMEKALKMLERGAPDIVEKCKIANVPIEPGEDVKKYLEICALLDYRDGKRFNPITGQMEEVFRYHQPSGKEIPDTFPTLEDAYENRKVKDGHYEKRIREAYAKGGADLTNALAKRDSGTVEMDGSAPSSRSDAGLVMKADEAERIMDSIDEATAIRQARSGNPELLNQLNEAFKVLGLETVRV